jgi:hypothetical protein
MSDPHGYVTERIHKLMFTKMQELWRVLYVLTMLVALFFRSGVPAYAAR